MSRTQRGEKINLAFEPAADDEDELRLHQHHRHQRIATRSARGVIKGATTRASSVGVSASGAERAEETRSSSANLIASAVNKDRRRSASAALDASSTHHQLSAKKTALKVPSSTAPNPPSYDATIDHYQQQRHHQASCRCQNCRSLTNLTECGVCLDSLQSNQIKSCQVCANVVCTACAVKLTKCAFCRSSLPPERNRALERLVDRLVLPCKNSRSGCKAMLNGESRFVHESICNFSSTNCPVGRGICGWYGTVASIQSHLQTVHNLQPLQDHGISIEIHSFRSKAKANGGRVYTVCLVCYDQLFVIRIVLYQSRLRLCFTRLGHATAQPVPHRNPEDYDDADSDAHRDHRRRNKNSDQPPSAANQLLDGPPRYGILVSLKAHSPSGRHQLRGLVPFGKFDREGREVSFTCDSLYQTPAEPVHQKQQSGKHKGCPPHAAGAGNVNNKNNNNNNNNGSSGGKDAASGVCREDLVKIDLLVKRLEEPN